MRWIKKTVRKIFLLVAIFLAKATFWLCRLSGKGKGSSLPGLVALRIYPGILSALAGQVRQGIIVVTGTNGKTTTNSMIARVAGGSGYNVLANLEGANLIPGVTAAFIQKATVTGKIDCDYACLEVDEASFPAVCARVRPDIVVVTNFFRDQLDRYGELDSTVQYIRGAIAKIPALKLVLNADDPLVAQLQTIGRQNTGAETATIFYGLGEEVRRPGKEAGVKEARYCPLCGALLHYEYYQYGQLGNYRCLHCSFARPGANVEAVRIQTAGKNSCLVLFGEGTVPLDLPLGGLYNLYNALAAFAAGLLIKAAPREISNLLRDYVPATGRMERYDYFGKALLLNLVKNPAGFNESLVVLTEAPNPLDVLIAINDNAADGRDISWLWDVDFEVFQERHHKINVFICTGTRAAEMGVRLKYAGVPENKIVIESRLDTAVDCLFRAPGRQAYLLTTYTALWPVEKKLRRQCQKGNDYAAHMSSVS